MAEDTSRFPASAMGVDLVSYKDKDYIVHHKNHRPGNPIPSITSSFITGPHPAVGPLRTCRQALPDWPALRSAFCRRIDWSNNYWDGMLALRAISADTLPVVAAGIAVTSLVPNPGGDGAPG